MYRINTESIGDVKKYIWHYRKGDKEYGPFTYEDMVDMVKKGKIGPDDYVLKFGNRKFIKVSDVQGLSEIAWEAEENKEEQVVEPEEQTDENREEHLEVKKEKSKEEYRVVFDNGASYVYKRQKNKSLDRTMLIAIACSAVGLCLLAWLFFRLF